MQSIHSISNIWYCKYCWIYSILRLLAFFRDLNLCPIISCSSLLVILRFIPMIKDHTNRNRIPWPFKKIRQVLHWLHFISGMHCCHEMVHILSVIHTARTFNGERQPLFKRGLLLKRNETLTIPKLGSCWNLAFWSIHNISWSSAQDAIMIEVHTVTEIF